MLKCSIAESKEIIKRVIKYDNESKLNVSIMLWGGAGVGKSSIVKLAAEELGYESKPLILNTVSPLDLRGIPHIPNGNSENFKYIKGDFIPNGDEEKPQLLFLDEINTSSQLVQAASYQIALDRNVGGHKLPTYIIDGKKYKVPVVLAGNRAEDGGATVEMPKPLGNRLFHIEITPNFDDMLNYSLKNHGALHEDILSFLRQKNEYIYMNTHDIAFPSPRTWEMASRYYSMFNDKNFNILELSGLIGEGAALELSTYLKIKDEIPNIDNVLFENEKISGFKNKTIDIHFFVALSAAFKIVNKPISEHTLRYFNNFEYLISFLNDEQKILACAIVIQSGVSELTIHLSKSSKLMNYIKEAFKIGI